MATTVIEEEEDELLKIYTPSRPAPSPDMNAVLEAVTEIRQYPPESLTLEDFTSIVSRAVRRNGIKLLEKPIQKAKDDQKAEPHPPEPVVAKKAKPSTVPTKKTKE